MLLLAHVAEHEAHTRFDEVSQAEHTCSFYGRLGLGTGRADLKVDGQLLLPQ